MHLAAWRPQVWVAMQDVMPVFSATKFKGGFATRASPANAKRGANRCSG